MRILIIVIVAIALVGCDRKEKYTPVLREWQNGDPVLIQHPELATGTHFMHFQSVLSDYGYQYSKQGEVLYIPKKLADDTDYLCNLTEKALTMEEAEASDSNVPVQSK